MSGDRLFNYLAALALPLSSEVDADDVRTEGFPASAGNPDGHVFKGKIRNFSAWLGDTRALELDLDELAGGFPEEPGQQSGGPVIRTPRGSSEAVIGVVRGFARSGDQKPARSGVYASRIDDIAGRFPQVRDVLLTTQASTSRINPVQDVEALFSELRLDEFTGREWLFRKWRKFLASHDRGYFLIEAKAGLGKSAFCAKLVREYGYIYHFTRIPGGADTAIAARSLPISSYQ